MIPDHPLTDSKGRSYCHDHLQRVCVICCVDYRFEDIFGSSDFEDVHISKDDMDGPVKDAKGKLYCREHHERLCHDCGVCYIFEDSEEDEEDEDEDKEHSGPDSENSVLIGRGVSFAMPWDIAKFNARREKAGKSKFIPSRFEPSSFEDTPQLLYVSERPSILITGSRYVRCSQKDEILIYTDGACSNNGNTGATGGCAFIFKKPEGPKAEGCMSFPLEKHGPTGKAYAQTSNRAELRAAIAALEYRGWDMEGWKRVVIATDSEYVTLGATQWVRSWQRNGWRTQRGKGEAVKNRDLWERLLDVCDDLNSQSPLEICFWRIPRSSNCAADAAAKEAATKDGFENYVLRQGVLV